MMRRESTGWKVDSRGITYWSNIAMGCTLVAFSKHSFYADNARRYILEKSFSLNRLLRLFHVII